MGLKRKIVGNTEIIRSRNLKKERQHNDQQEKDKSTNNDLQNITQKT